MFTEKKNGETDAERGLDDLIMSELEEMIFTAVAIVCESLRETRKVLKMFSRLLCFEQVKEMKIFSEKLYASKIRKTRRSRDEKQRLQLQKCQNGTNPRTVKRYDVSMSLFLLSTLYKTNRFHVAACLFSNRSQKTSKCSKNISDILACGSCATSLLLLHLTSSVIYN